MTVIYRFPVEGMTCTSCVARITRAVRQVDGVEAVRVDLASDSATIVFDPARTSLVSVEDAVRHVGYHARMADAVPSAQAPGGIIEGLRRRLRA